jgi:hypothetical protein
VVEVTALREGSAAVEPEGGGQRGIPAGYGEGVRRGRRRDRPGRLKLVLSDFRFKDIIGKELKL